MVELVLFLLVLLGLMICSGFFLLGELEDKLKEQEDGDDDKA